MRVTTKQVDYTKGYTNDYLQSRVWLELHRICDPDFRSLCAYGLFLIVVPIGQSLYNGDGPYFKLPPQGSAYCLELSTNRESVEEKFYWVRLTLDKQTDSEFVDSLEEMEAIRCHPNR
jgi:hypothetical protein